VGKRRSDALFFVLEALFVADHRLSSSNISRVAKDDMKKLTKDRVSQIKDDLVASKGRSQTSIANKHNVSRSTVSDIWTGRIHKNVPWSDDYIPVPNKKGGQHKQKEECNPTDERILELESELIHVTEERNREKSKYKASAKSQGIFRAIVKEMDSRIQPFKSLPPVYSPNRKKDVITEHAVMHLSDGHHDQVVTPEECGGLENYNFPISCARAERYVDTVIDWTQDTLSPKFHFTDLWVLAYGDHTSGEIHGHVNRSYFRNQFKNSFAIGQLHGLMYRDLSPYFKRVHVVYLSGNHGRRSPKKDFHGAQDNWDYLVAETARMYCRDLTNIEFLVPDAWSVNLDINGVGFNLSHGDDVRGNLGIPFYGMVRRQKGLIALGAVQGGPNIRYFCMGHHHVAATLSDVNGELLVNGAWTGTDSYAFNSFSGYREPAQWLHGCNPKYGITWRMNVKLKHGAECDGPKRYKIDGGRDVGPLR
jgi:hypothetical protein